MQLLKADYIYFPDEQELYQTGPTYKMLGGPELLGKVPVKSWNRVTIATGEDIHELGQAKIKEEFKERWFIVNGFPKDNSYTALVGSR